MLVTKIARYKSQQQPDAQSAGSNKKIFDERPLKKDGLHLTNRQKQFDSNRAPLIYTQHFVCISGGVNIQHIENA